jgi:hypothetical protein
VRRFAFSSILGGLLLALLCVRAEASPKRSLRATQPTRTLAMLDAMEQAAHRRRDAIARLQSETERRERSDRTVIACVLAIAGASVIAIARRKKPRA